MSIRLLSEPLSIGLSCSRIIIPPTMNNLNQHILPAASHLARLSSFKKVLVIDSNIYVAQQVGMIITKLNHLSLGSSSNIEQIELKITQNKPDYIIINMATSGALDGYQIAKILKLDYEIPYALIIKDNVSEERKWAEELNPDGMIIYSTNEDQLRNQIEVILS